MSERGRAGKFRDQEQSDIFEVIRTTSGSVAHSDDLDTVVIGGHIENIRSHFKFAVFPRTVW